MHRRSLALIAILVVALLAGAGGVYAYDQGKDGEIAEGIKVNGVDVGGLSASQARTKLRAALLDPLNRPVRARFEGKTYKLTPAAGRDRRRHRRLRAARADPLARGRHPQPHLARGPRPADPHRPRREGLLLEGLDPPPRQARAARPGDRAGRARRWTSRAAASPRSPPRTAAPCAPPACAATSSASCWTPRRPPARAGPHERRRARGLHGGPREEVSGGPDRQPRRRSS